MPFYYFDSTALVKRYCPERGTRVVNALLAKRGKTAIIATPTISEFYSVLANQAKQGELTRDDWYSVIYKFESEASRGLFHFISPTIDTYLITKQLTMEYPTLRAAQALHLALASELRPLRLSLVSADQRMLEFCRPLGIKPINPEDS
jgi:predicted nucleic acid-binding protein